MPARCLKCTVSFAKSTAKNKEQEKPPQHRAVGMGIWSLMKRTTVAHPPISMLCIKQLDFYGRNVTLEFRQHYNSSHIVGILGAMGPVHLSAI